ncbi:MAG TPA: hypothetical protein VEA77_03840, partial [Hyphomicrobium sp.]|nr:hypothetical protein [Hyphomicrobium sp.]
MKTRDFTFVTGVLLTLALAQTPVAAQGLDAGAKIGGAAGVDADVNLGGGGTTADVDVSIGGGDGGGG